MLVIFIFIEVSLFSYQNLILSVPLSYGYDRDGYHQMQSALKQRGEKFHPPIGQRLLLCFSVQFQCCC